MASPPSTATPSGKQQSPLTISGIQLQGVNDPSPELSGVAVTKDDYGFDSPMQDDELLSDEVLAELREINGMVYCLVMNSLLIYCSYNCLYVHRIHLSTKRLKWRRPHLQQLLREKSNPC